MTVIIKLRWELLSSASQKCPLECSYEGIFLLYGVHKIIKQKRNNCVLRSSTTNKI